jgi:hypothetical protein
MIPTLVLTVILAFPQVVMASQGTLAEALPKNGEVDGWTKHRTMQHFVGGNLYEYIDGGAEIYHEFGFVQVVSQDYVNGVGKSISVEIFEMESPGSAYGMYTFKTDAKGKRISVGNDAQMAEYYMNFWKGPFLVTLTGFDETEQTRVGLVNIARSIGEKIPGGGERPPIASFLPEEDLAGQSLKYFTGYLGLRNSHPFFSLNISGYEEGVKGDYSGNFSMFLFRYRNPNESQKEYSKIKDQKDRRGRNFFAMAYRNYLMLVLGNVDPNRAEQAFDRAREKILE